MDEDGASGTGCRNSKQGSNELAAVVYHVDLGQVQADPVLNAALSVPQARAPFDRIAWWQGLAGDCGLDPLLAVAREGSAGMVLPLRRDGAGLAALANWYSFRVAPVAFGPKANHAALLAALAEDLARIAPRLHLAPLHSDAMAALRDALNQAGWIVFAQPAGTNHVLPVNGRSFAAYLANRPGRLRTTLQRKAGKLRVELASRFDPALWTEYEAVYAASWKPSEGSPQFLRRFAEAEGAAGRLRLGIARVADEAVAAQFWTVEHGTAFIHKLAHAQSARGLSPGTTLTAALLEQVIDRDRVDLVDFGTGDEPYKRDWMELARPLWRIDAYRPTAPRNWPAMAKACLRNRVQRGKRRQIQPPAGRYAIRN